MTWRSRLWKWLKRTMIVGILSLFLLEITYRYQWVDFYRSEWNYHNQAIEKSEQRILVFGDSFSADPRAWVTMLRDSFPGRAIYNAALPGIGVETHHRIFSRRVAEVDPTHVIVQLYVGNDLYDIERPVNWAKQGFFRNLFWSLANDFSVLNFINYRLGQAVPDDLEPGDAKLVEEFSPERYSSRTRMYIRGDAQYPSSVIDPARGDARMSELCTRLRDMKASCPQNCRFTVLLVPHCTQVDPSAIDAYRQMGSKFGKELLGKNPWKANFKGMKVIDPVEAFVHAVKSGKTLYYPNDPHLNTEGNRLLMQLVAAEL